MPDPKMREAVEDAIRKYGSVRRAAIELKIPQSTVRHWIDRWNEDPELTVCAKIRRDRAERIRQLASENKYMRARLVTEVTEVRAMAAGV
jgi:hypothetical protein